MVSSQESLCGVLNKVPISFITAIGSTFCENYKQTESFVVNNASGANPFLIIYILNLLLTIFAFYLAFRCISKGGNAVGHILGACCCGIFYIAYALANSCM